MAMTREQLLQAFGALANTQALRRQEEQKKVAPQVLKPVVKPVWNESKVPVTPQLQQRNLDISNKVVSTTPGAFAYGVGRGISMPVTAAAKLMGYQESPEEAAVRTLAESKRLTSQMDASKGMGQPNIIQGRSIAPEMVGRVAGSILPFSAAESAVGQALPKIAGAGIKNTALRGAVAGGALQGLEEAGQGKRGMELAESVALGTALGAVADVGLGYLAKALKAGRPIREVLAEPETLAQVKAELNLPESAPIEQIERSVLTAEGIDPEIIAKQLQAESIPAAQGLNINKISGRLKGVEPQGAVITPQKAVQPQKPQTQTVTPTLNKIAPQANMTAPMPTLAAIKVDNMPSLTTPVTKTKQLKEPSLKVARVMTEPVKAPLIPLKEKAESVYQSLVSTGRPLERIGGKVRDVSSVIRKSAGSVDYVLGNKMIDREGNELGKSLVDIVGNVPKQQKEDLFTYAFHKHNIARMAQDKPVFGDTVTPEVSAQTLSEIEARNPGIAEKSSELTQYINNLMEGWAKKSGLVNDDTLLMLREMYPDYVPTYRDRSELAKSMNGVKGAGLNVIKKATGSSRDLLPLDQQLAEMTNRVIRSSRKNEMYNAMQDMADAEPDKMARFFKVISKEKQSVEDGIDTTLNTFDEPIKKVGDSYVLNYFRDGEKVQAEISKDMYDALRNIGDMTDEQKVAQVIRKYGTNPFKSLITQYNPLFALSNIMRDIPTAFVYSHNGVEWAKNMPVALKEIVSNGQYWKEYQALGGTRSGIFTAEKGVKPLFKGEGNKVKEAAEKALEGVEWFNNVTETLPRFAEYLATVKKGGNTYDNKLLGMMRAAEITTDFTRSGKATKFADAFVPYLNPSVQGIDKFFRQVASNPAQTAAKAGTIMTVPALILDQINKDNQEYKETSPREKNGFYLVPDGDGKFYRIPKSRETGVVFSTLFEWMARRARGEQVTAKEMIDNVKENFTPVSIVDSTLFTPLYKFVKQVKEPQSEVRNFAGIPIEPLSLKRYAPGERHDQYTSEVAKAIGKQLDISPKAIDYLLRSYSGIAGQALLPKTSQKEKPGIAGVLESKFKSDPVFKSENQNKLYDVLEKKQQEANSLDRQKGYTTSQDRKITTEPEKVVSALNKVAKELADYRKRQKEIDADDSIEQTRKQELNRNLQKLMNEKAKEALKKQGMWEE